MMQTLRIYRFINVPICMLFLVLFLSGCTQRNGNSKHGKNAYLNGNIYSVNEKIPENSTIIITISQSSSHGEKDKILYEYSALTQTESKKIPFNLLISNKVLLPSSINISARIEKEGIPIMMSDKMTGFPKETDDKLILTVKSG